MSGVCEEGLELCPRAIQLGGFLRGAPAFQGVGADGTQIGQGRRREFEFHFSPRTRATNAFLDFTGMSVAHAARRHLCQELRYDVFDPSVLSPLICCNWVLLVAIYLHIGIHVHGVFISCMAGIPASG